VVICAGGEIWPGEVPKGAVRQLPVGTHFSQSRLVAKGGEGEDGLLHWLQTHSKEDWCRDRFAFLKAMVEHARQTEKKLSRTSMVYRRA
jgi:hypothetical protein